jgi:hypothetical protein
MQMLLFFALLGLLGLLPWPVWFVVAPLAFVAMVAVSLHSPKLDIKTPWWHALKPVQKAPLSPSAQRLLHMFRK